MPVPTVFLVEDDPVLRSLYAELLVEEGYAVVTGPPPTMEAQQMAHQRPAVVLLDTSVATAQRICFCRRLKTAPRPPAVILLSTDPHVSDLQTPAGADAVLVKPFNLEELLAHLARLIPLQKRAPSESKRPARRKVGSVAHQGTGDPL